MLRIYLISNMYPTIENPAYGVFVKNFAESFQDEEFSISDSTLIKGKKSGLTLIWNYIRFTFEIFIKSNFSNIDIIYVHYIQHSCLPLHFWFRRSRKLILNAHGSDLTNEGKLYRWMRKLNRPIFLNADLMVIPSTYFIEKAINLGVHKENIYVYPSGGINIDLFTPILKKNHPMFLYRIGYLGRLDKGKGIETLFLALAKLNNQDFLHLDLVGAGQEEQNLRNLAVKLGINEMVTFVGIRKQENLPEIFSYWDALVFPSELPESLGLVGLEAMACGLPVIGSDNAGIKTYLENQINGFSFAPGNSDELKGKIEYFFSLKEGDLKKLRENALSTAAKYSRITVNKELKKRIWRLFHP